MEIKQYTPTEFLNVTDVAKQHLIEQIKNNDALGVRLGVMPNGCAGFEYTWDYVTEYFSQTERVTRLDDYVILVDDLSAEFLEGSQIDLKDEGIKGKTLLVNSPKATGSCGCGESVKFDL